MVQRRILSAAVAGAVLAAAFVALAASPASAALAASPIRFWGPNVAYSGSAATAKKTNALLKVGNVLYVGGNFDEIRPEPGTGVPGVSRPFLYAVDATTGVYLPAFAPLLNGPVEALEADPVTGTVFAGGSFTTVNGQANAGLAALDPTTGALKGTQRPIVNTGGPASVNALYRMDRMLYVGGQFTSIGGQARGQLARLSLDAANAVTSFQTYFTGGKVLALTSDGASLFVGGEFTALKDGPGGFNITGTQWLAAVVPATGTPITTFTPNVPCNGSCTNPTRARGLATANGLLFVAFGGGWGTLGVYNATGTVTTERRHWTVNGDVQAVTVAGGRLFVAGHFSHIVSLGVDRCNFFSGTIGTPASPDNQLVWLEADPDIQNAGHLGGFAIVAETASDTYWAGHITKLVPPAPGNPVCSTTPQTAPYSYIMRQIEGGGPTEANAPSKPANVKLAPGPNGSTVVSWTASTDDTDVTAYYVYLNGVRTYVASGRQTSFTIPGVDPPSAPQVRVEALDPFGNRSPKSDPATLAPLYGAFGEFTPLPTPQRIVDTRTGIGGPASPLSAGTPRALQIGGKGGLPGTGVQLVALNVTVANPTAAGFLTIYPDGEAVPNASSLNFNPGQTVPNFVMARLGNGGKIDALLSGGTAHVIVDVVGWVADTTVTTPGARLAAQTPDRKLDTRTGIGGPAVSFGPGEIREVQVVPANQGYAAVAVNLTGITPTALTFVTAFPGGQLTAPNASNLNLVPGQVRPNLVMVGVSAAGTIKLRNDAGHVHLVVDVVGAFKAQAALDNTLTGRLAAMPVPTRVVDTRAGVPIGQGATQSWNLGGLAASAPWGASLQGVVMNATATRATAGTFLTLFPGGAVPNASTLNVVPGQDVPNGAVVALGGGSNVSVYNSVGTVDYLFDVGALLLG